MSRTKANRREVRTCWLNLLAYCASVARKPEKLDVLAAAKIEVDSAAILAEHEKTPRIFAYVDEAPWGGWLLAVHSAILELPDDALYGILAHEAGHIGAIVDWKEEAEEAADRYAFAEWRIPIVYYDYGAFKRVETINSLSVLLKIAKGEGNG